MSKALLFISAMARTIMGQTTAVSSLFLPGFEGSSFVGSVITANPTMTQYLVQCAPGVDSSDCGAGPGVSVTMQSGTYALGLTMPPGFTMSEGCVINQDTATCTTSIAGSEANDPGVSTTTLTGITSEDFFMPVTITANSFAAVPATTSAAASESTGSTESTASSARSGDTSSVAPTPAGTESSSSTKTTGASTGGAPYVTGNAIMAGAIAIMGGALAL
ncbi:hypothetical protein F5B20DRAFT_582072 [Whalleya microplaca]|nr:hypothetical protein F5B20DRAFT_582072 [Whalleya microplaca]